MWSRRCIKLIQVWVSNYYVWLHSHKNFFWWLFIVTGIKRNAFSFKLSTFFARSKSTIGTLKQDTKSVQSEQQKHQSSINHIVLVLLLLTLNKSYVLLYFSNAGFEQINHARDYTVSAMYVFKYYWMWRFLKQFQYSLTHKPLLHLLQLVLVFAWQNMHE